MHPEGFKHVGRTSAISPVPARGVLEGGYLSFRHPKTGGWWLKQDFKGKGARVERLPRKLGIGGSPREEIDRYVRSYAAAARA